MVLHNPMVLSDKRILITGASAGIGRACAILLSQLGAKVVINGRHLESLKDTLQQMSGGGHSIAVFDMANTDELCEWFKSLSQAEGYFDGFVHCAGIQVTKPIRLFDQAFFDETMHVNLASAMAITKGFRLKRDRNKQGAIVFVASIAGLIGQTGNTLYGASKAGLMSLTRGLSMELLRDNIRVNCVAPALVDTEMVQRTKNSMTEAQFQHMLDQHPMGMGQPEDVANAVAFLLSDAAKWINAVTLPVEGGYLAN
ncbi:NAD(P)-dependent oxidoreductase [Shewanella morhuae]|uniref:3-oxoacyl-[acyl-carrier-protein] reductase FabG n=1 Tax=Shewanella morhuae TaxID=365591 RepID=A0A380A9J1_9GAMM|nr:SDR family oxidoreductase [Shewanella morhuae]PTA50810.1 NAD(P)-dependent oxidoreductase [Shewanella morhuae]SUI75991.1 3-oxoacyl-[acyl-carrier-protein] reductase FabG [Shewanella morhuae]